MNVLKVHMRVTTALIIREMAARFGDKPGGYVWALLDPLSHVFLMTLIFSAVAKVPPLGSDFPLFFASGYLCFQFYQGMSSYVAAAVKANKSLLTYPLVAPIDAVVARYVLQFITTSFVAAFILGMIIVKLPTSVQFDWSYILEALFAATLLGAGMGLINVTLFARSPLYEQIFSLVNRPMFMISGVFFVPDAMPRPYLDYLLYNPILHAVMCFRQGIYPEYRPEILDMGYLYEWVFGTIFVGLVLLSVSAAKLRND
ncbi:MULTISPECIES: ABC transporter permease [unclassified Rhizobium]|uniref:ABC transporter permease n=1 Tax=unclassified Rhizobium TaxID=2613769 RepID=UPI0006F98263|nr:MULTISPECIES: ABC transporter permease [unclassified Rhizobium]KQV34797.1 sugar ABC transporter [Rhizobium sp. Root1212]KRD24130.1 sugar ABC transporter [Rhizobium sp. Root268]